MEPIGIEPTTSTLRRDAKANLTVENKEFTGSSDSACTNACTNFSRTKHEKQIARHTEPLAAALALISELSLSKEEKTEAVRLLLAEHHGRIG